MEFGQRRQAQAPAIRSFAEFERDVQRRLLRILSMLTGALFAGYTLLFLAQHNAIYSVLAALGFASGAWGAVQARRVARPDHALRALCAVIFGITAWAALRQGEELPAAGWWLSVVPFILAGGGLYHLAIAAVLLFVGIVTVVFYAPVADLLPGGREVLPPWRSYIAVVGSELLALTLISVGMRRRVELAKTLDQARELADEALAAKARFLARMSHEIRTPLNGIIATADLLDSPRLTPEQREQLVALQRQSGHTLLALVNDVLDFSKLEAGKLVLEHAPLALRDVMLESNELFSVRAFAKGLEITSSSTPDVPATVYGDRTRLRQMLDNLVGNAVKFTERGGVHIHLALEPQSSATGTTGTRAPARCQVRIEVTDTGPGIAPQDLPRLFESFTQANEEMTRRFGGTGLGLALVRDLAQLMGGRVEVASTLGQGSRFTLIVPFDVHAAPTREPVRTRRDLLIVSASPALQRHLRSVLCDLGVEAEAESALPSPERLAGCRVLLVDASLLAQVDLPTWSAQQAASGRRVVAITPLDADTMVGPVAGLQLLYKPVRAQALASALASADAVPDRAAAAEPAASVAGLRVLVAEDNPVNRIVLEALLVDVGLEARMASDGLEALEQMRTGRYDLVLMDLHMPRLDGLETTRRWREEEAQRGDRRLPIHAMTAESEQDAGEVCRAAGMDGFLTKPFSAAQLAARVRRSLPARPDPG